jgi:hypothetical protein
LLMWLYYKRWERALYTLHSAWISALFGVPLMLLLRRAHVACGVPIDHFTLGVATCNLVVPGVLLVHWHATAARFAVARQLYCDAIATLCAWALAAVPYQYGVATLLLLAAVLDVLLVLVPWPCTASAPTWPRPLPCVRALFSLARVECGLCTVVHRCTGGPPVQWLDQEATDRRRLGERQMPGLTFAQGGIELGFGDFLVYGAFGAHVCSHAASLAAVATAVALGLVLTMCRIALSPVRVVIPALPLAVGMAAALLALERSAVQTLADALVDVRVWM